MEDIAGFGALLAATERAARGKRTSAAAAGFLADRETEVLALERELFSGSYRPRAFKVFEIYTSKPRTICAAEFRDRVVHHALAAVIEPRFEARAYAHSYACRRGKGVLAALGHARRLTRRWPWVLRLDIRRYFDSIRHDVLSARACRGLRDERVARLIDVIIGHGSPGRPPGRGVPIGQLMRQHFANDYLTRVDHFLTSQLRAPGYVRYMDDLVLFAASKATLWELHARLGDFLAARLGLELRPSATRLMPVRDGVPFLGFRVFPGLVRLDGLHARRLCRKLRRTQRLVDAGKASEDDAVRVAEGLIGWARHADTRGLRSSVVASLPEPGYTR